jgi:arsenate reductase
MKLKVYEYKNCGTCRKAIKYLASRAISFALVPIREQPPTKAELNKMLEIYQGNIRKLFNTSGQDYKKLKLKDKLAMLSEADAIELLSTNGNLVKRPFVVTKTGGLVGFNEEEWKMLK